MLFGVMFRQGLHMLVSGSIMFASKFFIYLAKVIDES